MEDRFGTQRVNELGVELGPVGQEILIDDEFVRVWAIHLAPGETQEFHLHRHPYLVVSIVGAENRVETIFGETRPAPEPPGNVVWRREAGPVHRLTNVSDSPYECRLIELTKEDFDGG